MSKITEVLKEARVFYVATVEGDQPRVRPFGAITDIDGKPYTCTNNTKNVYKQLMENPKAEISGCPTVDGSGSPASLCVTTRRKRRAMLEQSPACSGCTASATDFEVLRFEDAEGYIYSFSAAPEKITD